MTKAYVARIQASPVQENLLYIAVRTDGTSESPNATNHLFLGRSSDGGDTWTWFEQIGEAQAAGRLFGFRLSNQEPNLLWIAEGKAADGKLSHIYKLELTNETLSRSSIFTGAANTNAAFDIHIPEGDFSEKTIFWTYGKTAQERPLYRSRDGGLSWQDITPVIEISPTTTVKFYAGISFHGVRTNPYDPQEVFYVSDQTTTEQTTNGVTTVSYSDDTWYLFVSHNGGDDWEIRRQVEGNQQYETAAWGRSFEIASLQTRENMLTARLMQTQNDEIDLAFYKDYASEWITRTGNLDNILFGGQGGYAGALGDHGTRGSVTIIDTVAAYNSHNWIVAKSAITSPAPDPCTSLKQTQGYASDINTNTGSFSYWTTPLAVQTTAEPLEFRPVYSSQALDLYAPDGPGGVVTPTTSLGYGWTHSLDTRLILSNTVGGLPGVIKFKAHTTNQYVFYDLGGAVYAPAPGQCATLVREGSQYVLTDKLQNTYRFSDQDGRILEYSDAQGHSLFYAYDANNRLEKVMDEVEYFTNTLPEAGRYISFTYDANVEQRLIHAGDNSGRTITMTYNITGDLQGYMDTFGHAWTYDYI